MDTRYITQKTGDIDGMNSMPTKEWMKRYIKKPFRMPNVPKLSCPDVADQLRGLMKNNLLTWEQVCNHFQGCLHQPTMDQYLSVAEEVLASMQEDLVHNLS